LPFEQYRHRRQRQIEGEEEEVVARGGEPPAAQERQDEQQIDDRRHEGDEELVDAEGGQDQPSQYAAAWTEQAVLMLPARLQHAVGPAEALLEEGADRLRGFRVGERVFGVDDVVAAGDEPLREVGILGERVLVESALL